MDWLARDYKVLWHPFTQQSEWENQENIVIERGEGVYLFDTAGRHYLDGTASLWCNLLGHRHPALDAALIAQAGEVSHSTMLGLTHPRAIELAERLTKLTGLDRVFYSDSGSTAVEVALKMAFQAKQQLGEKSRTRFAALTEAYHGDTIGSVSVGGIELFHSIYQPMLFNCVRLPAPEAADPWEEARMLETARTLIAQEGSTLCAFVFEPIVQGAAGMRTHSAGFLRALCAMARAAGAYLVADEVATGFGRTGPMFASKAAGIDADFLCLAKALTGGYLPLAATLTTEAVFDAFRGPYPATRTFFHGHTYTGNPLACAVALATIEAIERESVLARAAEAALVLALEVSSLSSLRSVYQTRSRGMMAAVLLRQADGTPFPVADRAGHRVALAARKHGVILRNLGDTVMIVPALTMEAAELRRLVGGLRSAICDVLGG
jgi:adenosylmethionine-8-amino-7-oxononanoate aminotransferase